MFVFLHSLSSGAEVASEAALLSSRSRISPCVFHYDPVKNITSFAVVRLGLHVLRIKIRSFAAPVSFFFFFLHFLLERPLRAEEKPHVCVKPHGSKCGTKVAAYSPENAVYLISSFWVQPTL